MTKEWLLEHAKPLIVQHEKVHSALLWLWENNPLYEDIVLHTEHLNMLPDEDIAPILINTHPPSQAETAQGSSYNECICTEDPNNASHSLLQNVLISDLDMNDVSLNQLTAAAIKHLKSGKDYIAILHHPSPSNEYDDEHLFPLLYPTLFPYGIGGFNCK